MPGTFQPHFVFESLEGNLLQLIKTRKGRAFAAGLVASLSRQILEGLAHVHAHGFFHRDMKPENLLLTTLGLVDYPDPSQLGKTERDVSLSVKLADFGLAKELSCQSPHTDYVSTRWYRAPEILLHATFYSAPVDLWALGAIMAEIVNLEPLFPGANETAQLMLISESLGPPSDGWGRDPVTGKAVGGGPWPEGLTLIQQRGFVWPRCPPLEFSRLFGTKVPKSFIALVQELLRYEPFARPTAAECLQSPYMLKDAARLEPVTPTPALTLQGAPVSSLHDAISVGSTSREVAIANTASPHLLLGELSCAQPSLSSFLPSNTSKNSISVSTSSGTTSLPQLGRAGHVPRDDFPSTPILASPERQQPVVGPVNTSAAMIQSQSSFLHATSEKKLDLPFRNNCAVSYAHTGYRDASELFTETKIPFFKGMANVPPADKHRPFLKTGRGRARALLRRRYLGVCTSNARVELESAPPSPLSVFNLPSTRPAAGETGTANIDLRCQPALPPMDFPMHMQPAQEVHLKDSSRSSKSWFSLGISSDSPTAPNSPSSNDEKGSAIIMAPVNDSCHELQGTCHGDEFGPLTSSDPEQTLATPLQTVSLMAVSGMPSGMVENVVAQNASLSPSGNTSLCRAGQSNTSEFPGWRFSNFDQPIPTSHNPRLSTASSPTFKALRGPTFGLSRISTTTGAQKVQLPFNPPMHNESGNMFGPSEDQAQAICTRPLRSRSTATKASVGSRGRKPISISSRSEHRLIPSKALPNHRMHPYQCTSRPLSSFLAASVPPCSSPDPPPPDQA